MDIKKTPINYANIVRDFGYFISSLDYIPDQEEMEFLSRLFFTHYDENNNMFDFLEFRLMRNKDGSVYKKKLVGSGSNKAFVEITCKSTQTKRIVEKDNLIWTYDHVIRIGSKSFPYVRKIIKRRKGEYPLNFVNSRNLKKGKGFFKKSQKVKGRNILFKLYDTGFNIEEYKKALEFFRKDGNRWKGERLVQKYLVDHDISFQPQKTFAECKDKNLLPFDFWVPELNLIIEPGGIQHEEAVEFFGGEEGFKLRKLHDKMKDDFCEKTGKYVVRIKWNEFDNIDSILDQVIEKIRKDL